MLKREPGFAPRLPCIIQPYTRPCGRFQEWRSLENDRLVSLSSRAVCFGNHDARAAGIKLAIATTTSPENVAALLEVGLDKGWERYFAANGCGDIVPHKKPAPDIYFWVLDKLGLPASDCIALEDSNNGLRSALAAGIKTYVTTNPYTHWHDFDGAAGIFDDLSDLPAFYRVTGLPLPKQEVSV